LVLFHQPAERRVDPAQPGGSTLRSEALFGRHVLDLETEHREKTDGGRYRETNSLSSGGAGYKEGSGTRGVGEERGN